MKSENFSCRLEEISPHKFIMSEVPKPHSAFELYVAEITPNYGLSWIKAIGKNIATNPFGGDVKTNFENIKLKFEAIYGKHERIDFLMSGSIWNEPRDWMQALESNERILMTIWDSKNGSTMKDSLVSVALLAAARDTNTGFLSAEYEFNNHAAAEKYIDSLEDDAL
jgi:hypothetical protein